MISIYEAVHKFINNVHFDTGDCHSDYLTVEYDERYKYQVLKYKSTTLLLKFDGAIYRNRFYYKENGVFACAKIVAHCLNDHKNPHADVYEEDGMEKVISRIRAIRTFCSFCSKHARDVELVVAGPKVYICDECIEQCNNIIREMRELKNGAKICNNTFMDIQELNFRL